jgi:threonine synthase
MAFVSTRGGVAPVPFRTALFEGLAPDGGLYVPERIPRLDWNHLRGASLVQVGTEMVAAMLGDEIGRDTLERLLGDALPFPIPTVRVTDGVSALELFHGPTFAFKDVGARTMARLMAHFNDAGTPLTVLVATSGDTGSAVAQAFFGIEGTRVVVLFPEGGVTPVQEAQFTTLGGNVTAVAVEGTFDDCQRLAKEAFADRALRARARLTSANSINIGRLLPQMFYYAHAALADDVPHIFSVPSGNAGNLTAGLLAWRMGAPIAGFVAATTINDAIPRYVRSGRFEPRPSIATIANAMDVGNPSNVERMRWLFGDDVVALGAVVQTTVHTDEEVRKAIATVWERDGYLCDPHSAIGYLGLRGAAPSGAGVFLATAHPAKFRETVEPVVGREIPLPAPLAEAIQRPRKIQRVTPALSALRDLL